ncbi:GAF domain-containing protein [Halorubrum sp. SD626R]|nr:GAF domain-containing protein [Halorubrum sp. SD626R]
MRSRTTSAFNKTSRAGSGQSRPRRTGRRGSNTSGPHKRVSWSGWTASSPTSRRRWRWRRRGKSCVGRSSGASRTRTPARGSGPTTRRPKRSNRTRRVRLEPIGPEDPAEAAAVAGVPLHFGEATYGVIAVYAQTEEFRRHERDVLTALGRTVAIGINALESQRTLRGDSVVRFQLALASHPLGSFSEALSCSLRHTGTVGDRAERSLLFELDGAADVDAETVHAAAEAAGVSVRSILAAETDTPVVELSFDETPLAELIREYSGELCSWDVSDGVAVATIEVGREALARSLAADALERLSGADLRSYRRREQTHETRREFVAEVESRLTPRQRAALVRAHTSGYFEWPHETNGDEIADSMGVTRSTFHQHLRAAQRKIAAAIFER